MWTSIALASMLAWTPGQADRLTLTHARSTYGVLGANRPDNKVLPGDNFVLSFDIEGVKADNAGKVLYSVAMEVSDADGKSVFKQPAKDLEAYNSLGGNSLPAFASVRVGLDTPPGKYSVKVIVTDRATKASQSVTGPYEVLPKAFGLVDLRTTTDRDGHVAAPFPGEGQSLWINFSAVGFGREKDHPNLAVAMKVLDENGKPTLEKPFTGEVTRTGDSAKDVPKNAQSVPMQFMLDLNRAGKFTVELTATDRTSGKSAKLSFPLTVLKMK
jgi:hypothetical protein